MNQDYYVASGAVTAFAGYSLAAYIARFLGVDDGIPRLLGVAIGGYLGYQVYDQKSVLSKGLIAAGFAAGSLIFMPQYDMMGAIVAAAVGYFLVPRLLSRLILPA